MYREQYKDRLDESLHNHHLNSEKLSVSQLNNNSDHNILGEYYKQEQSQQLESSNNANDEKDDLNNNNTLSSNNLGLKKSEPTKRKSLQRSSGSSTPTEDQLEEPLAYYEETFSGINDKHQVIRATTPTPRSEIFDDKLEGKRPSLRRSSSLSTIPAYFYPDPYSIVVSKYLEDLGSLSSFSTSASGSEATEYLQLSRSSTPVAGAEAPFEFSTTFAAEEAARKVATTQEVLLSEEESQSLNSLISKMNFDSALSTSEEYQSFRSSVPLRKICIEADGSKEWKIYDAGPRTIRTPLLCLGPACATSDVFYKQILNLTARGVRVISVEGPVYWTVDDWCKGLKKLLDCLNLDKVHIFGASLGGFLAQKFAEYTHQYSRVASLILCNTFLDTSIFEYNDSAMIFWMLPSVILKKLIIENITTARIMDLDIAHAIEFMIERLNNLSQQELASRMTLNCVNCHVDTFKLKQIKMTIMDVFDDSALSSQAREDLSRHYGEAKLAHLKSGGNFPYLSRSDDVSMHILVHLRTFNGTMHSALQEESPTHQNPVPGSSSSAAINVSSSSASKNNAPPQDVFGSTGQQPASFTTGSLEDRNQAFKEKAASVLGLPVQ